MPKEGNIRSFLLSYSEFRNNDLTGVFSKAFITKIKTASWTYNLWADYFKINSKIGACGGQISPGSTRRQEGLTKCFGPIISQSHPFVG
jgi:hypothetical protein